ncbi:hypothetical protein MKX03_004162 [Papaver bracteatum]|nr:hypothetical protein MKX03_004162 [Papaver bracteatum]
MRSDDMVFFYCVDYESSLGNESLFWHVHIPMFIPLQQKGGVTSIAQSNVGNSSRDSSVHQDLSNSSFYDILSAEFGEALAV